MRDVKEGAWFVGEFCKVVAKQAWQHDLEIMLCAVNNCFLFRYFFLLFIYFVR